MGIAVRQLRPEDDRSDFHSGNIDLDRFFQQFAGQNQFRHHIGTTYVAVEGELVLGFATVAPSEIDVERIPASRRKRLPKYPMPVLRLARLAVDERARDRGVGRVRSGKADVSRLWVRRNRRGRKGGRRIFLRALRLYRVSITDRAARRSTATSANVPRARRDTEPYGIVRETSEQNRRCWRSRASGIVVRYRIPRVRRACQQVRRRYGCHREPREPLMR